VNAGAATGSVSRCPAYVCGFDAATVPACQIWSPCQRAILPTAPARFLPHSAPHPSARSFAKTAAWRAPEGAVLAKLRVDGVGRPLRAGRDLDREAVGLGVVDHRPYERGEERVRPGGAALELGVRLRSHVERVYAAVELHELHQPAVRRHPADLQPG